MNEPDARQAVLNCIPVGWRAFADAAAGGDEARAEAWARFVFGLFEALDLLDPGFGEQWTARTVLLCAEGWDEVAR